MTPTSSDLASDPTFQLNVILWAVMPVPDEVGAFPNRPILREAGYSLDSLGRSLVPRAAVQEKLATAGLRGNPSPDVILAHNDGDEPWPVLECKAHSFGVESSTASQAKKLIVVADDLAPALKLKLGVTKRGFLGYVVPNEDVDGMEATLSALTSQLEEQNLPTAGSGALGIDVRGDGVWVVPGRLPWPEPAAATLSGGARVLETDEGQDPVPLYILPYDPGLGAPDEVSEHGLRVLLLKTAMAVVHALKDVQPPERVNLQMGRLLSEATAGVHDYWRSGTDRQKLEDLAASRLYRTLSDVAGDIDLSVGSGPTRLEMQLRDDDTLTVVRELLVASEPLKDVEDAAVALPLPFADLDVDAEASP